MVAPHPALDQKIKNTKALIRQKLAYLIPEMRKKYPGNYISLEHYDVLELIKPWVERSKPRVRTGLQTLQALPVDRFLVLCVDFNDFPSKIPVSAIYNRFFSVTGKSFRNYYAENSYGMFIPEGEVHGWYRAPNSYGYYINNDNGFGVYPNNVQRLVEDVINLAANDPAINWSFIDANGDSIIDYLVIVHSGAEASYTGNLNDFWAHVWAIDPVLKGGHGFEYYAMVSEYMSTQADTQRTGIDSHEIGHLLGLPDLYDYSGNSNGVGMFSLMSHGSWADDGITPTHLDAWSKYSLGFSSTLINPAGTINLSDAERNMGNIRIDAGANEYFMLENRQRLLFDLYLPAEGVLIWHVNENMTGNDNELCFKVGLVQADGMKHLENSMNYGDPGDSYPGLTNNRSFGANTIPNSVLCDGSVKDLLIQNLACQ